MRRSGSPKFQRATSGVDLGANSTTPVNGGDTSPAAGGGGDSGSGRGSGIDALHRERLRWMSLALLVVQNVSLVLTMKASLTYTGNDAGVSMRYLPSVVVCTCECLKACICAVVIYIVQGKSFDWASMASTDGLKVAVPAVLYLVQNNLLFFAVSRLEPAVFQVTYQLKIATTAAFSVSMLGRSLTRYQLLGLALLLPGVCLVQLSKLNVSGSSSSTPESSAFSLAGLLAVILSTITSGFAGVYFEKVLKNIHNRDSSGGVSDGVSDGGSGGVPVGGRSTSPPTLWARNLQLATYSFVLGVAGLLFSGDLAIIRAERGGNPFVGFGVSTAFVVLLQAGGGLLVAAVVKYADNIAKAFATSVSVILASIATWLFFGFRPTLLFVAGAALVGYAVLVYSVQEAVSSAAWLLKTAGLLPLPADGATTVAGGGAPELC